MMPRRQPLHRLTVYHDVNHWTAAGDHVGEVPTMDDARIKLYSLPVLEESNVERHTTGKAHGAELFWAAARVLHVCNAVYLYRFRMWRRPRSGRPRTTWCRWTRSAWR